MPMWQVDTFGMIVWELVLREIVPGQLLLRCIEDQVIDAETDI
jgi:hypothetical protein